VSSRKQHALQLNLWVQLILLVIGGVLVGVLMASQPSLGILLGLGILCFTGMALAVQRYDFVIDSLIFLNIALIVLSAYAIPVSGGFDLQLNRIPLLLALPFWLIAFFLPPYRRLRFRFSWAFVWYALFTVFVLFSTILVSENSRTAVGQLAALIFRGALLVWLPQVIVSRRQISLAAKALLVGGAIIIAFAIFQYIAWFTNMFMVEYSFVLPFGEFLGMGSEPLVRARRIGQLFRLTLPFGSSSHLAPCIAALLLTAIGLWLGWSKRKERRAHLLVVYCLVMLLLLLGTYSRGAWLGFTAGLLTIVAFERRILLKRRVWRIALAILILLGLLAVTISPFSGTVLNRFDPSKTETSDESHLIFLVWALEFASSNPVVGIGWANYEARTGVLHAHNIYATILAEGGVIALLLWLLVCVAILQHGVRAVRASEKRSSLRYWNLGLLAAFVSFLVDNLFQTSAYFGFPWVIAGLIIASHYVTRSAEETDGRGHLEAIT
jgi:O-antigen ligase